MKFLKFSSQGTLLVAAMIMACTLASIAQAGPTYTVYATREGLVGYTTANGHVITNNSRFAALPSTDALTCNGCYAKTVTITYGSNTVTVPIWDVGPWNIHDDYWNSSRYWYSDPDWDHLPQITQGVPQSQAAYYNNHNNGRDVYKNRTVLNPAGIDLSNKVFWDDLGMSTNDWVTVEYNFVSTSSEVIVDNTDSGFSASSNWWTGSSTPGYYGTNYHVRSTASVSDTAAWSANLTSSGSYKVYARWTAGSNRASSAPYIVYHTGGSTTVYKNQQTNGGSWQLLGTFNMSSGTSTRVRLSCWTSSGSYVIADAIKLVKQ